LAEILPFRGLRYFEPQAGPPGRNIAPPYDIIDDAMREELHARSPWNIARLISPRTLSPETPYERQADLFREWCSSNVLRRDAEAAIYVYQQQFTIDESRQARTGMICLVRLVEFGNGVHPHEHTHAGPKADRLNLLRATRVNLGQVLSLYSDPTNTVDALLEEACKREPVATAAEVDGITHLLWSINDVRTISRLRTAMRVSDIFIADGHHRYETALNYMLEQPQSPAARYRMMMLVSMGDPGLVILPTHRLLVNVPDLDARGLCAALAEHFVLRPVVCDGPGHEALLSVLAAARAEGAHAFGLCLREGVFLVTLRDLSAMDAITDHGAAWKNLDVSILHALALERMLGIRGQDYEKRSCVEYVKHTPEALKDAYNRVVRGEAQALLLLNPPRVQDVAEVVAAGERMPQKSTFFYPKAYTGMVVRVLDDVEDAP